MATDNAELRWQRALADVARNISTFRELNRFSVELDQRWRRLEGNVDLPDLIYAEATRVLDPVAYNVLFSPGADAHEPLPHAHQNQLLTLEGMFAGEKRPVTRGKAFSSILAHARDRVWLAKVMAEVFGARVQVSANDNDLIKEVPEPSDEDRAAHRLRHPLALFDYFQLTAISHADRSRFMRYFETLPPEMLAVEFAKHIQELLDLYRTGKTLRLENFPSDVLVYSRSVLELHPAKLQALLIGLSVISADIRIRSSMFYREEVVVAKLIWVLLVLLPEDILLVQLALILERTSLTMLPEIHFVFRFRDEEYRLPDYFLGIISKERIERLMSYKSRAAEMFTEAFASKLADDKSLDVFLGSPNTNWVFLWYVDVASDKAEAQQRVVAVVKRQFQNANRAFIENLRKYFFAQPWSGESERTKAAESMFGGEYIWMLERLKKSNAI